MSDQPKRPRGRPRVEKRDVRITLDLFRGELVAIDQAAERAGMGRSAFIRHCMRQAGLIPAKETK